MKVTTQSGTVYEFTKAKDKVRRLTKRLDVDPEAEWTRRKMREDGKWLALNQPMEAIVGLPMYLVMEPLGEDEGSLTVRTTSPVVGIEP